MASAGGRSEWNILIGIIFYVVALNLVPGLVAPFLVQVFPPLTVASGKAIVVVIVAAVLSAIIFGYRRQLPRWQQRIAFFVFYAAVAMFQAIAP